MDETLTLGVTDSGLGGLAIAAGIVRRLKTRGLRRAHVVYFNCRPSADFGYNHVDHARKVRMFGRALRCMVERMGAQRIVVACNTLSVLLDEVEPPGVEVTGVVEPGAAAIGEYLDAHRDGRVALLGTPTTLGSGAHRRALAAHAAQLFDVPCIGLEAAIEKVYGEPATLALMDRYVAEAMRREPTAAALLCTHYPLAMDQLAARFGDGVTLIDPGDRAVAALCDDMGSGQCDASVEVISQVQVSDVTRANLAARIGSVSPEAAEALRHDACEAGLYDVG